MINRGMGWKPELGDHRDIQFCSTITPETAVSLPASYNLIRPNINWVYDQGHTNACTAYSSGSGFRYLVKQLKLPDIDPSKLFIYWNERVLENDTNQDQGAYIRDAVKSLATVGVCSETDWPSNPNMIFSPPTTNAFTDAKKDVVKTYLAVTQDHNELRQCLASGYPFIFGMTVFRSMMTDVVDGTGIVPMPGSVTLPPDDNGSTDDSPVGGHALLCVGYDDNTQRYEFLNSWGESWGDSGFGYLPYQFMEDADLVSDLWTLRSI